MSVHTQEENHINWAVTCQFAWRATIQLSTCVGLNYPLHHLFSCVLSRTQSQRLVALYSPYLGGSQSNGLAETGIRSVEGQVRVLQSALEGRYSLSMHHSEHAMAWLVDHAGTLLHRYGPGVDGKSPYHLLKGKPHVRNGYERKVIYIKARKKKFSPRFFS